MDNRVKIWPGANRFIEILHSTVEEIDKSIIRAEFSELNDSVFKKNVVRYPYTCCLILSYVICKSRALYNEQ